MLNYNCKRVTLFCGHYGSGKTNIAVNFAMSIKTDENAVAIADIDIVNPYFRTKDSEKELKEKGIRVIALPFANSSVDLPSLPSETYSLVQSRNEFAVFDIGGDDRGAYALGRFSPSIVEENNFDNLFVVNFYRPLTPDAQSSLEIMREIERASGIPFTGIVNNSNLGEDTTSEDVVSSMEKADELSKLSSLPVVFTSVSENVSGLPEDKEFFKLKLQKKYW